FFISLIYVFGMAITYCTLGLIAVFSGKIFGHLQNTSGAYVLIGVLLMVFGLMMMDVISIPYLGFQVQQKVKPKNLGAVLLFGITSGLIVGPCTAPVLATILTYVASKQNIIYGVSLLFVFSYGVGASLILIGTFSGLLTRLPKSGRWL